MSESGFYPPKHRQLPGKLDSTRGISAPGTSACKLAAGFEGRACMSSGMWLRLRDSKTSRSSSKRTARTCGGGKESWEAIVSSVCVSAAPQQSPSKHRKGTESNRCLAKRGLLELVVLSEKHTKILGASVLFITPCVPVTAHGPLGRGRRRYLHEDVALIHLKRRRPQAMAFRAPPKGVEQGGRPGLKRGMGHLWRVATPRGRRRCKHKKTQRCEGFHVVYDPRIAETTIMRDECETLGRLRRETSASQNWPKGRGMAKERDPSSNKETHLKYTTNINKGERKREREGERPEREREGEKERESCRAIFCPERRRGRLEEAGEGAQLLRGRRRRHVSPTNVSDAATGKRAFSRAPRHVWSPRKARERPSWKLPENQERSLRLRWTSA